jgi:hypothetical protein
MQDMDADTPPAYPTVNGSAGNRRYVRSQSDHQLPTVDQEDKTHVKQFPRVTTASTVSFPVIYEVPTDDEDPARTVFTFSPPPSASSSGYNEKKRRSTGTGTFERQLSVLDPMSDRVSTILVWENIVVSTRKDKQKILLHNVSGAITGGLWAVMGKLFFFSCIHR